MARTASSGIKLTRAEKMATAARLRRAGWTLAEIGDELGCNKSTVSRYCRELIDTLHAEALRDIDAWKSAQLAELQTMRDEAWEAWRTDKAPRNMGEAGIIDVPNRDASLLRVILTAQEREAKLLGFEQTMAAVPAITVSEERAAEILADLGIQP